MGSRRALIGSNLGRIRSSLDKLRRVGGERDQLRLLLP
jgi:hypothetical protein